jgi:hypothetical protein
MKAIRLPAQQDFKDTTGSFKTFAGRLKINLPGKARIRGGNLFRTAEKNKQHKGLPYFLSEGGTFLSEAGTSRADRSGAGMSLSRGNMGRWMRR